MASAPSNPTQLTPPRVALIDERSGAISREWYRFFLSLLNATQENQDQFILPDSVSTSAYLEAQLNALASATDSAPPAATESSVAALQGDIQSLALSPPPREYRTPRYGSFYDTTTQTAAAINTAYAMTFNTTDLSLGVTLGSPTSRVYVDRPNIYNVQFSAQILNASGGGGGGGAAHRVWIWLRKNGVDVPDSATTIRVQGNNTEAVAAWNFLLEMNQGDYFELMWAVDAVAVRLEAFAASAFYPSVPSVILTMTDNISSMET
jgi:hypothetical protein